MSNRVEIFPSITCFKFIYPILQNSSMCKIDVNFFFKSLGDKAKNQGS